MKLAGCPCFEFRLNKKKLAIKLKIAHNFVERFREKDLKIEKRNKCKS